MGFSPETEIEDLQAAFRQSAVDVARFLDLIPEAVLNKRPAPGKWSVAECIAHLNTTGRYVSLEMEKSVNHGFSKKITGNPPFRYGWFNRFFIRYMKPDSDYKLPSPKLYKPVAGPVFNKADLSKTYAELQQQYIGLLDQAKGLDLKRIKVRSPAMPVLRLSLGACFHAMEAHQQRHFKQAQRTSELVKDA